MRKITMPRNKRELMRMLENAYKAGADYSACVEHSTNIDKQISLGFSLYIDEITPEEWEKEINKYWI